MKSGLIKTHSILLQRENSEHGWLIRMETHVSVYFSEKPFIFYETNLPSRERFAGEPPTSPTDVNPGPPF